MAQKDFLLNRSRWTPSPVLCLREGRHRHEWYKIADTDAQGDRVLTIED